MPYYTTLPTSEKEKKSLIKPKIKDKTNLQNSYLLSFISIVLCKEKPVIQSSF